MPSTTTAEKAELRRRARQYLSGLSPQARRTSDDALFARFLALPQVEAADTLLLYHGMGGEPDTARLLPALWARGKAVCLPRCLPGHGMEARLVRPDSALIPHPYGMLEPGEDCPLVGKDAIGLVLVPGLAFDPSGGRLGQGGGFYDRWLADYAGCTAALCRTALLLPQVPRAPHDRGVELVLTEHGLYRAEALKEGFRQKLVMEMFEEYTMFERETHQVVFKEEETRILFQSKKQTIQSTLLSKEPQQVFQETQQILHQLFELEPFEFELVEETDK